MTELNFGKGKVAIWVGVRDGRHAMFFRPVEDEHEIGSVESASLNGGIAPREGDTVLWFDNAESAKVMQSKVQQLILNMSGGAWTFAQWT
jgi:hypothetical protein